MRASRRRAQVRRQRFRGSCPGGPPAGPALCQSSLRHQDLDPGQQRSGEGRCAAGQSGWRGTWRDRWFDWRGHQYCPGDFQRFPRAGAGVQEINSSITNMDEMTQQNSALVEESTAAARALSEQAGKLTELIYFFKLDNQTGSHRRRSVTSPQRPTTPNSTCFTSTARQPSPKSSALAAIDNDGWGEF